MKFLLDQNLSYRLVADLQSLYPGTSQVRLLGMEHADDRRIWEYAKHHGCTIVTKDSDFHELALLRGIPPKVIWLKCGNMPKDRVRRLLLDNVAVIERFHQDAQSGCLEIYP